MNYYFWLLLRFLALIGMFIFKGIFSPFIVYVSLIVSYLPLGLIFGASLSGNVIGLNGKGIEYVDVCAALSAYFLLLVLILLTKNVGFFRGVKMFIVGSLLVLVANVIRIGVLMYLFANNNVDLFINLHLLTWKLLSGVYVAFVWILLVKWFKVKEIPIISDWKKLKKLI
jgi:exosortase/archaeosortase family protein